MTENKNHPSIQEPKQIKDCWDKLDIGAKAVGVVVIPIILGLFVLYWNAERTTKDISARMSQIAVSILGQGVEEGDDGVDPLREWAVDVLKSPNRSPALTEEAASALLAGRQIKSEVRSGVVIGTTAEGKTSLYNVDTGQEWVMDLKAGEVTYTSPDGITREFSDRATTSRPASD